MYRKGSENVVVGALFKKNEDLMALQALSFPVP